MSLRIPMVVCGVLALIAFVLLAATAPDAHVAVSIHRDTRANLRSVNLVAAVEEAQAQADGPDGIPATWCGDEQMAEGTVNSPSPASAPQFKIVYAYAADRPDRFDGFKDALQADVAIAERFVSAQSGGTKSIRFDMGTSCGPQYADIRVVALPGPRAAFVDNFAAITSAVGRAIGAPAGPRNTMILADGLSQTGYEYGLGETVMGPTGEIPGPANVHNRGGLRSVLFTRDGQAGPGTARGGWWPEGFLHEITHNLGSVEWGAPHSTQPSGGSSAQYGHCWQGADVMCYLEDSGAAHAMQMDCGPIAGTITQSYDCGRDDYFNPAPAPGSYLATHWNTFDSVFLAGCQDLVPGCGGRALWTPAPPASTTLPAIAGNARRGVTMRTSDGTWLNAPGSFTRRWQRSTRSGWADIRDAESTAYVPSTLDLGRRLRVIVVANNDDGASAATSAATAPIGGVAINNAVRKSGKFCAAHRWQRLKHRNTIKCIRR